jgi:NAD(P)-dependent dehydrogenase (short-subunit alcohol dehydrogenase family)
MTPGERETSMLAGKRAIVTGTASGIGFAVAEHFAANGASVLMADIQEDAVAKAAAELGSVGLRCDVSVSADVAAAVARAVDVFGGLDIMVNNAGAEYVAPLLEHDEQEFERMLAVNLRGVFLGIKHAAPAIDSAGGGAIVNVASIAALGGTPLNAGYAASKAGVISLTQTAAQELRPLGIRVNAVCPGIIDTPMLGAAARFFEAAGTTPAQVAEQLQGRLGRPADIAAAVAFLSSDAASLISGVTVPVDGGAIARAF